MSELSLNVAPAPELLKAANGANQPAAPDRARPATEAVAGSPNPFAALLSGILQGAQPAAESAVLPAEACEFPDLPLPADAGTSPIGLPGLPGTAPPLPGPVASPAGNGLPPGGNPLPPALAGTAPDATATTAPDTAPDNPAEAPAATRPRVFLGDLAQSRPLETAADLPLAGATDGARNAAVAALAGRSLAAGSKGATDGAARPASAPLTAAPGPTIALSAGGTTPLDGSLPAPGTEGASLRLGAADLVRVAGLPVAGPESLAVQLAAFATSNDSSSPAAGTATLTGAGPADGASSALLGRLGTTGLPPLQPLGDAGAFAGGLADRLMSLGGPGAHSARLKLHPEHLGELDVEITMDDGTAQVWFGTTTSQARDAIESSLPRLREMFAEQGIQLTRTQVDAGSGQPANPGFGQERRMPGSAGAWNDNPAWQPGRTGARAERLDAAVARASTRLLDVWA